MLQNLQVQKAQLFENDPTIIAEQCVLINIRKSWINITHGDSELSISVKNWNKLIGLMETRKPEKLPI